MASRERKSEKSRPGKVVADSGGTRRAAKKITDHNERRRLLYATDPTYRARVLKRARLSYNKGELSSKLENGVLRSGVRREVRIDYEGYGDGLHVIECYTLRETGEALGRVLLTVRSWIASGILPEPIIKEASTGYKQYSRKELDVIAEVIARHESHSQYISAANTELVDMIWVCAEEIRKELLD
jgi:hypothetical protein